MTVDFRIFSNTQFVISVQILVTIQLFWYFKYSFIRRKKQLLLTSHYWFIYNVQMAVTLWWKFSKIDFCCVYHNNKYSQLSSIIWNKSFYLVNDVYSNSYLMWYNLAINRQGSNIGISNYWKSCIQAYCDFLIDS